MASVNVEPCEMPEDEPCEFNVNFFLRHVPCISNDLADTQSAEELKSILTNVSPEVSQLPSILLVYLFENIVKTMEEKRVLQARLELTDVKVAELTAKEEATNKENKKLREKVTQLEAVNASLGDQNLVDGKNMQHFIQEYNKLVEEHAFFKNMLEEMQRKGEEWHEEQEAWQEEWQEEQEEEEEEEEEEDPEEQEEEEEEEDAGSSAGSSAASSYTKWHSKRELERMRAELERMRAELECAYTQLECAYTELAILRKAGAACVPPPACPPPSSSSAPPTVPPAVPPTPWAPVPPTPWAPEPADKPVVGILYHF